MPRERGVQLYHWQYLLRRQHVRTFLYHGLYTTAVTVPVSNAMSADCPEKANHQFVNVDSVNDIKISYMMYRA